MLYISLGVESGPGVFLLFFMEKHSKPKKKIEKRKVAFVLPTLCHVGDIKGMR